VRAYMGRDMSKVWNIIGCETPLFGLAAL